VITTTILKSQYICLFKIYSKFNYLNYFLLFECRFESVQALVDYYSRVSLKEYNHNLDLKLTYGVSKFKFGRTSKWSIDKLYASFREALEKYESLTKSFIDLESDIGAIREDLFSKRLACEAFDKIIELYENQRGHATTVLTNMQLKKSNAISTTTLLATQFMPSNKSSEILQNERIESVMLDNKLRLDQKIIELQGKKELVVNDIDYLNVNLSELQEKLDSMRSEIIELRKKRENYHMWLLQRGENEDKIQTIIEPVSSEQMRNLNDNNFDNYGLVTTDQMEQSISMSDLNSYKEESTNLYDQFSNENYELYYMDSLNWFRADFSREKAVETLQGQRDATFLVRSSMYPGSKYVLSLVIDDQVVHILIDEFNDKYFLKPNDQRRLKNTISQQQIAQTNTRSRSPSCTSERNIMKSSSSSNSFSDENHSKDFQTPRFDTLSDLIIFYSKNELSVANQSWNTVLKYPAFCSVAR